MRMLTAIAICIYSALMMGGQAWAQQPPQVIKTITAAQVSTALQAAGYRASVLSNKDGSKYVKTAMNNFNTFVLLANCSGDDCTSLVFYFAWAKDASLTVNFANAWNSQWRYAKAYLESDGTFVFTYDLNLDGGITMDSVRKNAVLFDGLLAELIKMGR
jgi:hypothetical protein